jgi:hypothetical protein
MANSRPTPHVAYDLPVSGISAIDHLWTAWERLHDSPPATLYHYSAADGLLGILEARQFWATNVRFMNDTSELAHGVRLVRAAFDDLEREASKAKSEAEAFEIVRTTILDMVNDAERNTSQFAVSFCTDGNLLSQWRGYGQFGGGYAVGFITARLSDFAADILPDSPVDPMRLRVFLRQVIYDEDRQKELIRRWIDHLVKWAAAFPDVTAIRHAWTSESPGNTVARLIYEGLVSFKHPAFAEEGEWRLIQQGRIQRRAVCRSAFRTRGGRIVSYTPLIFHGQPIPDGGGHPRPNDFPVASITCGPTLDAEGAQRALRMLLEHLGFEANGVEITSSNIPFAT